MTNAKANYQEFTTLPAWTRAVWKDGKVVNATDPFKWSGSGDPPAIGATVKIYMNKLGTGTVTGYFVEYGWFGVLVALDEPPDWWVKQNGATKKAHLFGLDLEPRKTATTP